MAWLSQVEIVTRRFEELTGRAPDKVAVAPGRVNLIGEHIDYSGFGVLPCAVARFTVVAVGIKNSSDSDNDFALAVTRAGDHGSSFEVRYSEVSKTPPSEHHWSNYVLAAYLGLREAGVVVPRNIELVVGGDLPQACGLSSSSSLVVACALALSSVGLSKEVISPETLAEICIKSERYVGVIGGGMDQAAIALSEAGYAMRIDFDPVRVEKVRLPDGLSLIVANSLTKSAKAETANSRYNKRVFECKLAAYFLRLELLYHLTVDPAKDTLFRVWQDLGSPSFDTMIAHSTDILPEGETPRLELRGMIPPPTMDELVYSHDSWNAVFESNDFFSIRDRAVHVFSEAQRVGLFVKAAEAGDIDSIAVLMNESGESCDQKYDCSCPELRELIKVMKDSGCTGARLTGAGWGGCAVGVAETGEVDAVVDKIQKRFFRKLIDENPETRIESLCFSFEPCGGAFVIDGRNMETL